MPATTPFTEAHQLARQTVGDDIALLLRTASEYDVVAVDEVLHDQVGPMGGVSSQLLCWVRNDDGETVAVSITVYSDQRIDAKSAARLDSLAAEDRRAKQIRKLGEKGRS